MKQINRILNLFKNTYEYTLPRVITKLFHKVLKKSKLDDIIFIESHNDFDCNGGAFYNYLIEHHINQKYKIVWLLKHTPPKSLPYNVTYCRLYRPSFKRAYYSCKAKYLLADCVMTPKYRNDQISIYLTHGAIGLKSVIGKENVHQSVDYILAGSPNYDSVYRKELSISPNQELLHFGFPCLDTLFFKSDNEITKISGNKYSKILLWMPTFRVGGRRKRNDSKTTLPLGIPIIESEQQLTLLDSYLKELNILLILKLHPMQDPNSYAKLKSTDNIKVLTGDDVKKIGIDNYRLLKDVDALISDYSSIAFQYILLNRPIGFVLSDMKELKSGLAVDNPEFFLAGEKIFTYDDFVKFISDVANGIDTFSDDRKRVSDFLYKYHDGKSCERLAGFLKIE